MIAPARISRRGFLAGAGLAGSLTATPGWALDGETLVLRGEGDIGILDPAFEVGYLEEEVGRAIFCSLNRLSDFRRPLDWTLHAASALTLADPLTLHFTLRDGLRWTDGFGPLTAEDVRFSFERLIDPALGAPNGSAFERLDRVEVLGSNRGILHLKQPYVPLMTASLPYWAGHIVCREAVERVGGRFTTAPPATCGPYRLDSWAPRRSVTLVADPDWPGPPPAFPRVRYEVIAEDEAASLAFEAGAVACTRISVNTLAAYKAMPPPNARLLTGPGARYSWLTINICHPKLTDIRIRRALQHAIDNAAVALGAYSGLVLPATGIIPPSMLGHRERVLYPPDPARARALLTEAGVTDLRLRLSILNDDASGLAAQILTSQLADIGITLDVVAHDEAVYWSLGDRQSNPDWQAIELVLMNFTGGVDPSESLTWFRPNGIGVFNWSQFDSTAFEALYQESLTEADPEHRAELTRRAQDLMEESGGFVFMVFDTYAAIHRDDIEPFITPDNFLDAPRFTRR